MNSENIFTDLLSNANTNFAAHPSPENDLALADKLTAELVGEDIDVEAFNAWCDKYAPPAYVNEPLSVRLEGLKDIFLSDTTK